jgi:hypothetical protein
MTNMQSKAENGYERWWLEAKCDWVHIELLLNEE